MTTPTTLPPLPPRSIRNAGPRDLVDLLQTQHRQKLDIVVPRAQLGLTDLGHMSIAGLAPVLSDDGVTDVNGSYRFTAKALGDLAPDNLTGIPVRYLRRLAADHPDLLATNVNTLLWRDARGNVLVRAIYGSDDAHPGSSGIVRAIKSDRFACYDNLDLVFSVLSGVREAGLAADQIEWRGADLADDKLWLRIVAPEIAVDAPNLLAGYRSPYAGTAHGGEAAENPYLVHAGFVVQNDETGGSALSIRGELRVKICDNGLIVDMGAMRQIHMGARLGEGQITWSADTREANATLIAKQCRDAVQAFLTRDYVAGAVAELEKDSGHELDKPADTIALVARELSYSDAEQEAILSCFTKSGQCTSGGIMQAVTAAAQGIDDVARANDFAATGVAAMRVASRLVRTGR